MSFQSINHEDDINISRLGINDSESLSVAESLNVNSTENNDETVQIELCAQNTTTTNPEEHIQENGTLILQTGSPLLNSGNYHHAFVLFARERVLGNSQAIIFLTHYFDFTHYIRIPLRKSSLMMHQNNKIKPFSFYQK